MLVHFVVDEVHADDTCDIVFIITRSSWVFIQLSSSQYTRLHTLEVVMGERISTQTFGHKPSGSMSLLSLHDKELQSHEKNDPHDSYSVSLHI